LLERRQNAGKTSWNVCDKALTRGWRGRDLQSGEPCLAPFSFLWDGERLLMAMPAASQTGRNLQASGSVRLGIGQTRDIVLIEGTVDVLACAEISVEAGNAFTAKTGFDPRQFTGNYLYFSVRPQKLQARREAHQLSDRYLMRDGRCLVP
jgi:hypothetical protein